MLGHHALYSIYDDFVGNLTSGMNNGRVILNCTDEKVLYFFWNDQYISKSLTFKVQQWSSLNVQKKVSFLPTIPIGISLMSFILGRNISNFFFETLRPCSPCLDLIGRRSFKMVSVDGSFCWAVLKDIIKKVLPTVSLGSVNVVWISCSAVVSISCSTSSSGKNPRSSLNSNSNKPESGDDCFCVAGETGGVLMVFVFKIGGTSW